MRHVSEDSANCLACACTSKKNECALELLRHTKALSITGVIAAIYLADSEEHIEIVRLTRAAIRRQRDICESEGPRDPGCVTYRRRHHDLRSH